MLDYASRAIDPYVNSRAGFEFTANAAVDDAAGDGVRRLEMSFDVRAAGHYDAGFAGWASFIRNFQREFGSNLLVGGDIDARSERGYWVHVTAARRATGTRCSAARSVA